MEPIIEFGHHHDGFGLAAAADRECAGDRPALNSYRRAPCEEQYDRAFPAGSRLAPSRRASARRLAMNAASLAAAAEGDHVALAVSGAWTVERAAELERLIEDATRRHAGARSIDIDLAGLEQLDTFGAWLIERLKRSFVTRGSAARITGLSETDRALMVELRVVNQAPLPKRRAPNAILHALNSVGRGVAEIGASLLLIVQLLGALVLAALGTIAHPTRLRFTSIVHHLEKVGWRAVPIIALSTFLIGGILAQQGIFHFRTFGADDYVVDLVGMLVCARSAF